MSQNLPARPSLEHLRKQAKLRLDVIRARNPDAKLADALHAIAREYGFPTWPKLKEHVLAVSAASLPSHPLAGRWMADAARSQRHPANLFRSAIMQFDVRGDTVDISHRMVDESGREEMQRHTIQADGIEHQTPNGYLMLAKWDGPRLLQTVATKDGVVVGRGQYEISDDDELLTISSEDQRIVCYRT
jgi:hypothetical protein